MKGYVGFLVGWLCASIGAAAWNYFAVDAAPAAEPPYVYLQCDDFNVVRNRGAVFVEIPIEGNE